MWWNMGYLHPSVVVAVVVMVMTVQEATTQATDTSYKYEPSGEYK